MAQGGSNGSAKEFGPRSLSNYHVITRTVAGLFGGGAGTVVLILTLLLASNIFQQTNTTISPDSAANLTAKPEINVFFVMAGAFLATLAANMITLLGFSLFDREKYSRMMLSIIQVLIVNLLVFVFTLPAYLLVGTFELSKIAFLVGTHIIVATLLSMYAIELLNGKKYIMVGFYGITLGLLLGISFELITALRADERILGILMLTTLPILLGSIGFFSSLFEMFYGWLYRIYGIDWLGSFVMYDELEDSSEEETMNS